VKDVWVLLAVGAAQVFLLAGAAHAVGTSFFDDFPPWTVRVGQRETTSLAAAT